MKNHENMKNHVVIKRLLDGAIILTLLSALTQSASARITLPDATSTSSLVGVACFGLVAIRRFLR
jgi:hypothetical protein